MRNEDMTKGVQQPVVDSIMLADNSFYPGPGDKNADQFEQLKNVEELPSDNLVSKIKNKSLKALQDESLTTPGSAFFVFPESFSDFDDITEKEAESQFILASKDDGYRTGNIAGFMSYKDQHLVITSRFYNSEKENEGADLFLMYLISKVFDIPNILQWQTSFDFQTNFFDFLMLLFPYQLQRAARKGLFKQYVRREYNDANVRGAIDVPRHIRLNTPFLGKVAYNQREFSYDNYLMQLVRHTIEVIKAKPQGRSLLFGERALVNRIVAETPRYKPQDRQRIVNENIKRPVRHAYYHEYRELQRLCLAILQHQKHGLGTGSDSINGILFDVAWLWEEYLNTIIGANFLHPENKKKRNVSHLFTEEGNGKLVGAIYPDFISRRGHISVIADAKYKPIENIGGKGDNGDYFQMLSYLLRFDSKQGFFLYPEEDNKKTVYSLNQSISLESGGEGESARDDIKVIKLGLGIPKMSDAAEFAKEMKMHEGALKGFLDKTVNGRAFS